MWRYEHTDQNSFYSCLKVTDTGYHGYPIMAQIGPYGVPHADGKSFFIMMGAGRSHRGVVSMVLGSKTFIRKWNSEANGDLVSVQDA